MTIDPTMPSRGRSLNTDRDGSDERTWTGVSTSRRLALVGAVLLVSVGIVSVRAMQPATEPEKPLLRATEIDASLDPESARHTVTEAPEDEVADDTISTRFARPVVKPWTSADLPQANLLSGRPSVRPLAPLGDRLLTVRGGTYGRSDYPAIIAREAASAGVPRELVQAVMAVESRYNPAAVGADGEIGLMQIMPGTARMLGFSGSLAELADAEVNIAYGTAYLAGAWRLANRDICVAAMKYRAGHGESRFSFLSVEYCNRVRAELAALGFPVTGSVPLPTFGQPGGPRGRAAVGRSVAQLDFKQLNMQLRQTTERVVPRAK